MKHRRENRIGRLASRVKAIILDEPGAQAPLTIWKEQHPITWLLVLKRLREDEEEVIRNAVAPLLGPGDQS